MKAMSVVLTILVAGAALYVILTGEHFTEVTRNWAYGALTLLLGYWLRQPPSTNRVQRKPGRLSRSRRLRT